MKLGPKRRDCIGGRVVEVNVYSPGGLVDMERFHGVPFVGPLLDALTG